MSEATAVLVDNSEWTRSGDYAPTRFQVQQTAIHERNPRQWGLDPGAVLVVSI
jgi:hypothetical protein